MIGDHRYSIDGNPWCKHTLTSCVLFGVARYLIDFTTPKSMTLPNLRVKWTKNLTSLFHSVIAATWSMWLFFSYLVYSDMVNGFLRSAHTLLCITMGYFLSDTAFMIWRVLELKRTDCLLFIHHVGCIALIAHSVRSQKYVPLMIFNLMVEINSVLLHSRVMLKLCQVHPSNIWSQWIEWANLVTMFLIRIPFNISAVVWVQMYANVIPSVDLATFHVVGLVMLLLNLCYCYLVVVKKYI